MTDTAILGAVAAVSLTLFAGAIVWLRRECEGIYDGLE